MKTLLFLLPFVILSFGIGSFRSEASAQVKKFAIAIHGGAGVIPKSMADSVRQIYVDGLTEALTLGKKILSDGGTSLDAVEQVIRLLEDNPLFNAGKGSVFTAAGTHEMDASIMDGRNLECGAVTGVRTVKNPISLARLVMEKSRHILFAGAGAEAFASEMGVERVDTAYFFVERRFEQWQKAVEKNETRLDHSDDEKPTEPGDKIKGTVGVVALDQHGNLAAGTSTGGMTNKMMGRVGDSPIVGAGTYADNATCGVSGTGHGEQFIRHAVAYSVSARMKFGGQSLQEAAQSVIFETLKPGDGGIIAVDRDGNIALVFNSKGMFRGKADASGLFEIKIWE